MSRSMDSILGSDSILADEPSVHTLPEGQARATQAEPAAEPTPETDDASVTPAPKAEVQASTKSTVTVDDDEDDKDDPVDQSIEGLRKALTAVRGDKRKMRKQWREAEERAKEAAKSSADTARRLAALEGQLTVYQQIGVRPQGQAEKPGPAQLPDFFSDPDAHLSAREKLLRDELGAQREAIKADQFKRDAARSERRMIRDHEDYNEAKAAFLAVLQSNPQLWAKVAEDPEPAEVVYEEGKKILRGGVSESEAQLQSKVAELESQIASLKSGRPVSSAAPGSASQPKAVPKPSIASARGTGNGVPAVWTGPRSPKAIYD